MLALILMTSAIDDDSVPGRAQPARAILIPAGESGAPVQIYPGDLILADMDGIVVIPAKLALQVVEDSEELQRIEQRIAEEMRGGAARSEAMKRNPRFQHVRAAFA